MLRVAIDGVVQDGYPTPRLIENNGGKAYRKGNIWYLYVPGQYESEDGLYVVVTLVRLG